MQITVRSEEYMKSPTWWGSDIDEAQNLMGPTPDDSGMRKEWRVMRNILASGEVLTAYGERLVGDYWACITTMNGRTVIRRITSKEGISRRITVFNRIKRKYEEGIYSGDFVVMKSSQALSKHSWPLVFKSGVLHAITNHIEWINAGANAEGMFYDVNHPAFLRWINRNIEFPPYASPKEKDRIRHRMLYIFLLRQLNSKRLWKSYIKRYDCRFGYLTYSKGKAKMWQYASGDHRKVMHDLTDKRKKALVKILKSRGFLISEPRAVYE
jgi:hypothetical protein